ncbi:MAG: DUF1127 domain-containing protein [Parvibaculaceae bacterium]
MNRISVFTVAGEAAGVFGGAIDLAGRTAAKLYRLRNRGRTRMALGHLDDRLLADIGLTRGDVLAPRFEVSRARKS